MDFPADLPPFSRTFFEDIVDEKKFTDFINLEYSYHAALAGYTLDTSPSALWDVHQRITKDIERLSESIEGFKPPDHFKRAGYIAYWLRRYRPVIKWDDQHKGKNLSPEVEISRKFFNNYIHEYLAFNTGYLVSLSYVMNSADSDGKIPHIIDARYFNDVCYLMKYKSISPHAMNMIYRSLFLR